MTPVVNLSDGSEMVEICNRALAGDRDALDMCEEAISSAAEMGD